MLDTQEEAFLAEGLLVEKKVSDRGLEILIGGKPAIDLSAEELSELSDAVRSLQIENLKWRGGQCKN